MALRATRIDATDNLQKNVKPEERNCYYPEEYKLEVHQKYSQGNCFLECYIKLAVNRSGHSGVFVQVVFFGKN